MSEQASTDKIQPSPEDLLACIIAIKQQHADYGIKKVHAEVLLCNPNWTLSENRVKKFMQDNGLSASVSSASSAHVPHAEECLRRDRAAILADSQQQIDSITKGVADLRIKELNPKGADRTTDKKFEFWSTQPMLPLQEKIQHVSAQSCGPIEPLDKHIEQEPLHLPPGLEWSTFDVLNADDMTEVYHLLNGNYVEDDDSTFRFDYSREFLMWALTSPGWIRDYHLCIKRDGRMVCMITAVPAIVQVWRQPMRTVEINFLCIHKDLRSQRMSPLLIKEITRRVNLRGTFQAIYTAGVLLPKPISVCRYHHRLINLKKLEEIHFARQPEKLSFQMWQKLNRLPETPLLGMRPMGIADVPAVTLLLTQCVHFLLLRRLAQRSHAVTLTFLCRYLERFGIFQVFDEAEVRHWILPRPGIISCYVLEQNKKVTDFVSFYHLNSTVLGHSKHKILNACYMYYRVATTGDSLLPFHCQYFTLLDICS